VIGGTQLEEGANARDVLVFGVGPGRPCFHVQLEPSHEIPGCALDCLAVCFLKLDDMRPEDGHFEAWFSIIAAWIFANKFRVDFACDFCVRFWVGKEARIGLLRAAPWRFFYVCAVSFIRDP
jgi:hypothetical protein